MLSLSVAVVLLTVGAAVSGEVKVVFGGSETRIAAARGLVDQNASPRPSEYLGRLSPARRRDGRLDVELTGVPTPELRARTSSLENLWRGGRHDDALADLRMLEDEGLVAGVGIGWRSPEPALDLKSTNVPIDASGGADQVLLDFDPVSGNLFSVVRWGKSWGLFISMDQGATWFETYHHTGSLFVVYRDMDLDVHPSTSEGDYAYLAYATHATLVGSSTARIRRFSAATGAPDDAWGNNAVLSDDTRSFQEIAIAITGGGTIFYPILRSDGSILCLVGLAANGSAPWVGQNTQIIDAARGLDATYPGDSSTYISLWISYVSNDDHVILSRRARPTGFIQPASLSIWPESWVDKTSIAAYLDSAVVSWEYQPEGTYQGVRSVSVEATGTAAADLDKVEPPGWWNASFHLRDPLVAGSDGSTHNAMIYTTETDILYHERNLYATPGWNPLVLTVNEHDFVPGKGDTFAFEWLGRGYGVAYHNASGDVYFFKTWLFSDGFEKGNISAWSSSVP